MALTALEIKHAKSGTYADGNGLYLQVRRPKKKSAAVTKSWIFRFQIRGKRRYMGLGSVDETSAPLTVRAKAAEFKLLVDKGIDPIEKRNDDDAASDAKQAEQKAETKRASHTFRSAAEEYIDVHRAGWANAKHGMQWENTLATYVFPLIGDVPVTEITAQQVQQILLPIWVKKTETAVRIRSRIELVLDYAKGIGWRTGDNPATWRGNMKRLLPSLKVVRKVRHFPALPWKKMPEFMADLRKRDGMSARALEFGILTAARSGEVRGALWSEIDFDTQTWCVPAARMKAKLDHRAALSADAIALLRVLPRFVENDLVFPSPRAGHPLSDTALTMMIRRMNEEEGGNCWVNKEGETVVPHGFRSSFRDWVASNTTYQGELAEKALAHAVGSKTEGAYQREDMLEKRRPVMEDWAAWCRPIEGNKVVSINMKAA